MRVQTRENELVASRVIFSENEQRFGRSAEFALCFFGCQLGDTAVADGQIDPWHLGRVPDDPKVSDLHESLIPVVPLGVLHPFKTFQKHLSRAEFEFFRVRIESNVSVLPDDVENRFLLLAGQHCC